LEERDIRFVRLALFQGSHNELLLLLSGSTAM